MRKALIFVMIFASVMHSYGQDWSTIPADSAGQLMQLLSNKYREHNYKFSFKRSVYINATDTEPFSVDEGFFARGSGKGYRSESYGQLLIQNNTTKMAVMYEDSAVLILPVDTLFDPVNFSDFTNSAQWKDYRYEQQRSGSGLKIRITAKFSGSAADVVELWLNPHWELTTVVLLLPEGNYVMDQMDDQTMERPKTVITYTTPVKLDKQEEALFDLSNWLSPYGDTFVLTPEKDGSFELEDLRYNRTQH